MALTSHNVNQGNGRQAVKSRQRLWQSLQALGGISLLSSSLLGSVALAQESAEQPLELASPPPEVAPVAAPEIAPETAPIAEQAPVEAPLEAPVAPLPAPTIAPPSDFSPELSTPQPFESSVPVVEPTVRPTPSINAPIDSSDLYQTGATERPSKPLTPKADSRNEASKTESGPTIVITERSNNCQAPLQGNGANCGKSGGTIRLDGNPTTPEELAQSRPNPGNYSVGRPSANPIEAAANYLGRGLAPSFDAAAYYARSIRPLPLRGNGDRQFLYPLSVTAPISSVFGWRLHPIHGEWRFHTGTDFAAEMGTPVVAPISGRVSTADFVGGYGLTVTLDHNTNQQTLYGHLSQIFVKSGQFVKQGDVIGLVGSTGNSTGPHLHFEVRQMTEQGWIAVDPAPSLETAVAGVVNLLQNKPGKPFAPNGPLPTIPVAGKLPPGTIALTGMTRGKPQAVALNTPLEKTIVEVMQALQTSRSSSYAAAPSTPGNPALGQPVEQAAVGQPTIGQAISQPAAQLPPVPQQGQPMFQQPMVQPISTVPSGQPQAIAKPTASRIALELPKIPSAQ